MEQNRRFWLEAVKGLNMILLTVPFALVWYLYYRGVILLPFYRRGNWLIIAMFFCLYSAFGTIYDAFTISTNQISEMVYSQSLSAFVSDA
ncbi:MAG: sugar transferase, partial [Lachnospiraceae bacterium]|nr:sugar transferase [Lachnospiraceae bacterium]